MSSIRVDNKTDDCQNPGANQVTIFQHNNYAGDCVVLNPGHGTPGHGYPDPSGNAINGQEGGGFGLPDNYVSSLKVGSPRPGHNISLYDSTNFGGASILFGGSEANLGNWGWNDRATSITVN
jgi:hypothetical protein